MCSRLAHPRLPSLRRLPGPRLTTPSPRRSLHRRAPRSRPASTPRPSRSSSFPRSSGVIKRASRPRRRRCLAPRRLPMPRSRARRFVQAPSIRLPSDLPPLVLPPTGAEARASEGARARPSWRRARRCPSNRRCRPPRSLHRPACRTAPAGRPYRSTLRPAKRSPSDRPRRLQPLRPRSPPPSPRRSHSRAGLR
jgi:hypothetical protein